jgi:hypothetical protein
VDVAVQRTRLRTVFALSAVHWVSKHLQNGCPRLCHQRRLASVQSAAQELPKPHEKISFYPNALANSAINFTFLNITFVPADFQLTFVLGTS